MRIASPRSRSAGRLFESLESRLLLTAYYFSGSGNDTTGAGTQASPWATIAKANTLDLNAGDSLNFQGGSTFSGSLNLDATDAGTATTPVTITSYGTGRATLTTASASEDVIYVYNAAGIDITNLNVTGPGSTSTKSGIEFYMDLPGGVKLDRIRISQVDVSGFNHGLIVGAWNASYSGFRDVRITNVNAFSNVQDGISSYGYWVANSPGTSFSNENFYVGNSKAYNNTGNPNSTSHSGSGIVLSGILGATIEDSEAYNNGNLDGSTAGGPVGIWFYEVKNGTIQHSISHDNKRGPSGKDGGGFDLDGGCQNCVIQYCYSYNNQGPGYLLAQYSTAGVYNNNTIRYNISQNDSRSVSNSQGAIDLWSSGSNGGLQNSRIYNNTVYLTSPSSGDPAALRFESGGTGMNGVKVYNNIFVTTGTKRLVYSSTTLPLNVSFAGNAYYASGTTFRITWAGTTYNSLAAWRTATAQETVSGLPVGFEGDPRLTSPGGGALLTDPALLPTLSAYQLLSDSPLINTGQNLTAPPYSFNVGTVDFYGDLLPQGSAYDVGADEFRLSSPPLIRDSFLSGANPAGGEYAPNTLLDSANPAITGVSAAWSNPLDRLQSVSAGLTYASTLNGQPVTLGTGGSVQRLTSGSTSTVFYTRAVADTASTTVPATLWFAGLIRPGSVATGEVARILLIPGTGVTGGAQLDMGIDAGTFVGAALGGTSSSTTTNVTYTGTTSVVPGNTYLFVGKLTITSVASGVSEALKIWVNPADISSETSMNTSAQATGDVTANVIYGNYKIGSIGVIAGGAINSGKQFDEIIAGHSLAEIQGVFIPGGMSLMAVPSTQMQPATLAASTTSTSEPLAGSIRRHHRNAELIQVHPTTRRALVSTVSTPPWVSDPSPVVAKRVSLEDPHVNSDF